MKKTWIIGFYIAAVLLIAGFSRAQALPVDRVFLDESHYMLMIGGRFSNTCEQMPRIEISKPWWQASMKSVTVRVVPSVEVGIDCREDNSRTFDLVVDLRELPLPVNSPALISVLGQEAGVFSMHRVELKSSMNKTFEDKVEHTGTLVEKDLLQLADGSLVNLKSVIDLEPYLGRAVQVRGIQSVNVLSSAAELVVFDPNGNSEMNSLLVTEISSVPLQ